ncbi:hypothetical protein [Tessaracoccus massiliensis]|uniref:hypothetical protein n=1 Tax=Tessaracoccus massiliensis TaxID=1522311 RepID=UPI0011185B9B|nr:hypothetical protein [Tessaracoccus massiliensis]
MMADRGGGIGRAPNGAVAILAAGAVDQRGCGKVKTTVALMAGAFIAAPLLSACNSGTSESLPDIVAEMASQAGSDQVVRVEVEREPELHEGLRVRASFVLEDGTAKQFLKRPYEDDPTSLGSPTPSVLLSGKPAADLDLAGLERRMDELPECKHPQGELFVFGEHVAENVRCGPEGAPTGRLDGTPVPAIPAGDLAAAAEQLRDDAALLGATQVGRVTLRMTPDEVWTQVQMVEPALRTSGDDDCALLVTRSMGSFFPKCEAPATSVAADSLDPAVIAKIWAAEGAPKSGWWLELVGRGEPGWQANSEGGEPRLYTLDGDPV